MFEVHRQKLFIVKRKHISVYHKHTHTVPSIKMTVSVQPRISRFACYVHTTQNSPLCVIYDCILSSASAWRHNCQHNTPVNSGMFFSLMLSSRFSTILAVWAHVTRQKAVLYNHVRPRCRMYFFLILTASKRQKQIRPRYLKRPTQAMHYNRQLIDSYKKPAACVSSDKCSFYKHVSHRW